MPVMTHSERTALSPPDFCLNHCPYESRIKRHERVLERYRAANTTATAKPPQILCDGKVREDARAKALPPTAAVATQKVAGNGRVGRHQHPAAASEQPTTRLNKRRVIHDSTLGNHHRAGRHE